MTDWSPRCPKCGGPADAIIRPTPDQILGGRLRPAATSAYPVGRRVRCTKCHTWFLVAAGTVWEPRPAAKSASEPLPEEDHEVGQGGVDEWDA